MSRALPPYATLRQEALLEPCPTQEEAAPEAPAAETPAVDAPIAEVAIAGSNGDRPGPMAPTSTSTEPTVSTASATGTATAPARRADREPQPSAFVTCQCKISRGQVAQLTVPVRFTTEDAEKIAAFLLSWIDDPAEQ